MVRYGQVNCSGIPVGWEAFGLGTRLACYGGNGVGGSTAAAPDGRLSRRAGGTWVPASSVIRKLVGGQASSWPQRSPNRWEDGIQLGPGVVRDLGREAMLVASVSGQQYLPLVWDLGQD